jgi:hypothetical protein
MNASGALNETKKPMISHEEAISSVRNFLGAPGASVTVQCVIPTYYGVAYSMESAGDCFTVNGLTGEVEYADYRSRPVGNFRQGSTVIDVEAGRSMAEAFAREHYAGFNVANMSFLGSGLYQDGNGGYFYEYEWRDIAANSRGLNDMIVTVGVGSRKIHTYHGIHAPADIDPGFTVSKGDAVLKAVASIGNITQNYTTSDDPSKWKFDIRLKYTTPDPNGNWYGDYHLVVSTVRPGLARDGNRQQRVIWNVELHLHHKFYANETIHYYDSPYYQAYVVACSGEVLELVHSR